MGRTRALRGSGSGVVELTGVRKDSGGLKPILGKSTQSPNPNA
jgi:hypothetical protein